MRAIPNMTVLCPADANEMASAVRAAADWDGPCYIRANRNDYPNTTAPDAAFQIGMPTVLREGTDVTVFAMGYMLNLALEAAEQLAGRISVRVVNVSTLKPLTAEMIRALSADVKGVVTVEEHSVIGGLGSAVAEALCRSRVPMEMVGVNDSFGCSAHSYQELLEHYGLTAEHIVQAIESIADAK